MLPPKILGALASLNSTTSGMDSAWAKLEMDSGSAMGPAKMVLFSSPLLTEMICGGGSGLNQ